VDYLPLTIRQIFYRLVGVHDYEKTERGYKRLCEHLNRARRARIVAMDAIRDDSGAILAPVTWHDAAEFLASVKVRADLDASGAHLFLAAMEDIQAFAHEIGGDVTFTRLAVTREQIARYDPPTAPKKSTDKRAFRGTTCQAEALAPDVLAGILRTAIEARIDRRVYERVLRQERTVRRELMARLGSAS
jgi:hypothetical protein